MSELQTINLPNGNRISEFRIVKTDDCVTASRKYTISSNCPYCHSLFQAFVLADYSHDPFMELIEAINHINKSVSGCRCFSHTAFSTPSVGINHAGTQISISDIERARERIRGTVIPNYFDDTFRGSSSSMTATQVRQRMEDREWAISISSIGEAVPRDQRPGRSSDLPDDGR